MIILIYLSGWFSGTETALTNLNAYDIAEMKKKNEKNVEYIIKLKEDMDKTLVTILIGNNIVNIVLSSIAAIIANELFHTIGVSIMVALITFLIIIFGEITPKSNAIWDTNKVAKKNAKTIYYLMRVLMPLVIFFMVISRNLVRLTGKKLTKTNLLISDDSIKNLATLGEEKGVIKKIERDIIHQVFVFGDRKIEEIMVPIKDVFHFDINLDISDASKQIANRGFTRIPVIDKENNDEIVGILYSKDIIEKEKGPIKPLLRKPYIVNSQSDITDVFSAMKKKRMHIAIVKNSNGTIIGIVTLEDILEELVGEIYDEYFETKYKKVIASKSDKQTITSIN